MNYTILSSEVENWRFSKDIVGRSVFDQELKIYVNFGKQARSPVIFVDSKAVGKEYNQGSYDQVVNGRGPASPFLLAHTFGFCFIYILSTSKGHTIVQEEYIDTPVWKIDPILGGFLFLSLSRLWPYKHKFLLVHMTAGER